MKYVNQDVSLINQGEGIQGIYDIIAQCAATCYQSEAKNGESAETFVEKLIKNKHTAMLEFGTVYLRCPSEEYLYRRYHYNPYSKTFYTKECLAVTTNYRVLVENGWLEDLKYICKSTENHHKRYIVKAITSIGVARELTRHRTFSFAQESTRYCNYGKSKYNKQITFIKPEWYYTANDDERKILDMHLADAERSYNALINWGRVAQDAREVLPLATKTEICVCGFEDDWKHFFDLRLRNTTGSAHPDMSALAEKIYNFIDL